MKAGWTSLGEIASRERLGNEPWVGGSWRFTNPSDGNGVRRGWSVPSQAVSPESRFPSPARRPATNEPAARPLPGATDRAESRRAPRRRRGRSVLGIVTLALLSGAAGGVVVDQFDDDVGASTETITVLGADPAGLVERPPESIAGVAARVLPSVVSVSVDEASGSGFVISEDGYVLTNNHVITAAGDSRIELALVDGREFEAEVVGSSPSYDIAVLKIDADNLKPVTFGESRSVAVGDPVVAIGSPLGLDATVTSGIVSALERPVATGAPSAETYINALQTDAAINPGNSGGPLVDSAGRVIGVTSAIATLGMGTDSGSIGLGFAIPIEQVQRTADQLIRNGEAVYPIMGVLLDNTYSGPGARVAADGEAGLGVSPGGPADQVGIQPGDLVVEIDGEEIRSPAELIVRLRAHQPGDEITLMIQRGEENVEVTLTLDSAVG